MLEYPDREQQKSVKRVRMKPSEKTDRSPEDDLDENHDKYMMSMATYLDNTDQQQRLSKNKFDVLVQINSQRHESNDVFNLLIALPSLTARLGKNDSNRDSKGNIMSLLY